jgi:hypothetical protein
MQVKIALAKVALLYSLDFTGPEKSSATDTFTASRQVQSGTKTVNTNSTVGDNQSITDSNYSLTINVAILATIAGLSILFSGNGNTYNLNLIILLP